MSLISLKRCIRLAFLTLCLAVWSSWSQNCLSDDGQKKCCMGYLYEHQTDQCLKCPDGYYGENCSDICPYPYFGELCRHKCNCSSDYCHPTGGCILEGSGTRLCTGDNGVRCCFNHWYKKESRECVECNPGYFGINCMEMCPFPSYGVLCTQSCNCSVEDCYHATGCSLPSIETNDTKSFIEKIEEFSQKRIYLVVVAYVFGGVLIAFVLIFIWIELSQRTRRTIDEQKISAENVPVYHEIIM